MEEVISKIEAILFVVGDKGISIDKLKNILNLKKKEIINLVNKMIMKNQKDNSKGIILKFFGDRLKFVTKKMHHKLLIEFSSTKEIIKLKQSALESLAIIAYNSPITRVEIDSIRGVDSSFMISKLLSMGLITEAGRAKTPGLPILYAVTPLFMDKFNIESLHNLPKLDDLKPNNKLEKNLFESNK